MLREGDRAPAFRAQPVFGLPLEVPGDRPVVLVFVRHLGCPYARETIWRLQESVGRVNLAGARLAVVARAGLNTARDFVPRHHVLFPVVADLDGVLFQLYRVPRYRFLKGTVASLASTRPPDLLRPLLRGAGKPSGPVDQLPAEFVVDGRGVVRYCNYPTSIFHVTDPSELLGSLDRLS